MRHPAILSQKVVHGAKRATAPIADVPSAGERLTYAELQARFGVRPQDGICVNRPGKCIVLVDRAGNGSGRTEPGGTVLFRADQDGSGLSGSGLLLSRSKEEDYKVLCFTKEDGMLKFASIVEYDSHAFRDEEDSSGGRRRTALFRLRIVGNAAADAAGKVPLPHGLDPRTVESVERVIFVNHPYESKDRLLRVLPEDMAAADLDRILDYLLRSAKITLDGEVIRWTEGAARSDSADQDGGRGGGAAGGEVTSIFTGTRFESMEEGKLPTETAGEYIARRVNADEPGAYTAEDVKEIDEDLRRLARGEYYTREQVRKEFGI